MMLNLKINTVYIFIWLIIQSGYSQSFPPPENLLLIGNDMFPTLIWDAPSKDLSYYKIYRNNLFIDSTTALEYTDTLQFTYNNEWFVTALYSNPDGESQPSNWTNLCCQIVEEIPYLENFDLDSANWSTKVISGQEEWKLVDTTSFSGNQSAGFYSSGYGDKSLLYSSPIGAPSSAEVELSFWYKCPIENNNSDELLVYRVEWPMDTIYLTESLSNINQWTEKKINLGGLQSLFLRFESTSKGGGGVFIDSIQVEELNQTSYQTIHYHQLQLYQNSPNPFSFKTKIGFYLPKDEQVKMSIYNQSGLKLKTILDSELQYGEHFIDFRQLELSSGIYFYSLETSEQKLVKKFIIK